MFLVLLYEVIKTGENSTSEISTVQVLYYKFQPAYHKVLLSEMIQNYCIPKADFPFNFHLYLYFKILYFIKKVIEMDNNNNKNLKIKGTNNNSCQDKKKLLGRNKMFFFKNFSIMGKLEYIFTTL